MGLFLNMSETPIDFNTAVETLPEINSAAFVEFLEARGVTPESTYTASQWLDLLDASKRSVSRTRVLSIAPQATPTNITAEQAQAIRSAWFASKSRQARRRAYAAGAKAAKRGVSRRGYYK